MIGAAHDRDQEGVFAADDVADAAEKEGAERAHQEAGRVGGKAREERRSLIAFGEEQRGKKGGERRVEIEVVPLEDGAERACEDDALLFGLEFFDGSGGPSGRLRHKILLQGINFYDEVILKKHPYKILNGLTMNPLRASARERVRKREQARKNKYLALSRRHHAGAA
jgi:hypothetical protein